MHAFGRICPSRQGLHESDCLCQDQDPECDNVANCIRCGETECGDWVYDNEGIAV